jgi:hypothetical protein
MNRRLYSDKQPCKRTTFAVNFTIITDKAPKIEQKLISFNNPVINGKIVN